jgi:hypothetical protein
VVVIAGLLDCVGAVSKSKVTVDSSLFRLARKTKDQSKAGREGYYIWNEGSLYAAMTRSRFSSKCSSLIAR